MSNKFSVCHQRVKYTSYELVKQVKEIVDKHSNIKECAEHYKTSEELIKNILKNLKFLLLKCIKLLVSC